MYKKYANEGMGLSQLAFQKLDEILDARDSPASILEFGSGISTKFFCDRLSTTVKFIHSLDNSEEYCFKEQHLGLDLVIANLASCTDESFNKMFAEKRFIEEEMYEYKDHPTFRQKNCFYNSRCNGDIKYDMVIVDGPNGNGRSLGFLAFKEAIAKDTIIFIDDLGHSDGDREYLFEEHLRKVFDVETFFKHNDGKDTFGIFKVIK